MDKTEGTGQRVGGYRVVRRLATGGTSEVLLAKAEGPHGFERSVVLKLLLSQYTHDEEFKGMFAREAAAYARLSHPSIVRLYDFFANEDQLVMVLEYIDGPALSRLRGMLKAVGQHLDDATSIHIATGIFSALAAAHGASDDAGEPAPVIHRDVNPTNILVPWDGQVKLADFGIAKVTGASHQSSVGLIKGTFGYMAPEQVKGETVSPRADVYAAAIVLWEMLTKRRAFIRGALPEIEVLRELAEPRIVSIDVLRPDLDKSVRDAIKRALEPRGEKRTITAEEMNSILRAVVSEGDGRESLAKALALVRHEPKVTATSIPPPVASPAQTTPQPPPPRPAMTTKQGLSPKMTPPPRPAASAVPRKTAPYAASPPPVPGSSPRLPAVAPSRPAGKISEPPTTEVAPSSVRGLAAILEPSASDPRPDRAGHDLQLATPLADATRGRDLMKDAIDEILRDIPSDVPPNVFPKTDPPGGVPMGPGPLTREIGKLPAAPPPLDPSVPLDLGATFVDSPVPARTISSVPPAEHTLAMERSPVNAPERAAPQPSHAVTAPMPMVAPKSPSTSRMHAFVPQKVQASTLPLGAMSTGSAPPFSPAHHAPAPGSYPPAHVPSSGTGAVPPSASGAYGSIPSPSAPPEPQRRSSVLPIVALLLLAILAGGAGFVVHTRRTAANAAIVPPAPTPKTVTTVSSTSPFVPIVEASAEPTSPAPASAAPIASAAPATSASASASSASASVAAAPPVASATQPVASASATAPASASASASADTSDLPPGTGRVKTTGAAPGRRIFVDEKTVGQTPDAVVVKCGVRSIKVGSAGSAHPVDVPCGGEITIGDR